MRNYKVKESYTNLIIILGIVMLVVGIISGLLAGHFTQIGLGALFVVLGVMQKGKELAKFNADYMELKPAPLAATLLIKYSEIDNIEVVNEKKVFLYGVVNGKNKRIRLPITLLTNKDQKAFLEEIKTKVA